MSREEFDHFLLTRFYVRRDIHSEPASEEWLRYRLGIFRQWSLPSVRGQTVPPDTWLIFCDSASPEWFKGELGALLGKGEEIVWVNGVASPEMFAKAVFERLGTKQYLITSRLDNDDAISQDFVRMVQNCFEHQVMEFINFTYGAQYCDGRFFARVDPSNAFVSLIERRSNGMPKTVHIDWHNRLEKYAPVHRIKTHYAWLQNVHGGNVANVVRGIPVPPDNVLRLFSISVPALKIGHLALLRGKLSAAIFLAIRVFSSRSRIKWLLQSFLSKDANARIGPSG